MKNFLSSILSKIKFPGKQLNVLNMFQSDAKLLSELPEATTQLRTLLIVKTDAIGDYILFRDFLRIIREHYKGYKISLVGNRTWRTLAEALIRNSWTTLSG